MKPFLLSLALSLTGTPPLPAQALSIAPAAAHLQSEDGTPFFYLADTAWEMLHRCNREETAMYLKHRAAQGYNVIQTVILAELEGLTVPNANGDLPLIGQDPARINEAYFEHVDYAVHLADSLGIYLALLPTWGDKFYLDDWGKGPLVFTPANAQAYGKTLGERYGEHNVIWILGGDRDPQDAEDHAIIHAMAAGLRSAVAGRQLLTYHPRGGSCSVEFFRNAPWLDFHMYQTGHSFAHDTTNFSAAVNTRRDQADRPVINGEPCYEGHAIGWDARNGWFKAFDARRAAWWSIIGGAAGHTYGHASIWQMWQPGREMVSEVKMTWKEALSEPGAEQVALVKRVMSELPYGDFTPLGIGELKGATQKHNLTVATGNAQYLLAYSPYGESFAVARSQCPQGDRGPALWIDPRTGERFGAAVEISPDSLYFDPPGRPARSNDWVLLMGGD